MTKNKLEKLVLRFRMTIEAAENAGELGLSQIARF